MSSKNDPRVVAMTFGGVVPGTKFVHRSWANGRVLNYGIILSQPREDDTVLLKYALSGGGYGPVVAVPLQTLGILSNREELRQTYCMVEVG